MSESSDPRHGHGAVLWVQLLAFLLAALLLMSGVGYAVMRWLEGTA